MTQRSVEKLIPATEITEGAGVTVHRTIGTPALRNLDPFLMLDHFGSNNPDEYGAGFPDHPHRGFITLTYMLDGHMLHQDSMGNRGDLRTGGIQWMKAASGVIHSEMPQQTDGLMRGFQLWINLPATEKMSTPEYQNIAAEEIPEVDTDGARVRVIGGTFKGVHGAIKDPHTEVQYLDISLQADSRLTHKLPEDLVAFAYVFEGSASVAGQSVARHHAALLTKGDEIELAAGPEGARLILVAGKPLGEPIVQYGPFVMNTEQEIRQAFDDYRNNRLVKARAETV